MLEESEINCHYHAAIKFFGQESGVTTKRSDVDGKTAKKIVAIINRPNREAAACMVNFL